MKELTIEEKAQRYDEAIERARQLQIDGCSNYDKETIWNIFPELKESDERIRKELTDFCIKCSKGHTIVNSQNDFARWATWLKSFGPQNRWKPSEQDILLLERIANGKANPQDFQASLGALIVQLKKLMEE